MDATPIPDSDPHPPREPRKSRAVREALAAANPIDRPSISIIEIARGFRLDSLAWEGRSQSQGHGYQSRAPWRSGPDPRPTEIRRKRGRGGRAFVSSVVEWVPISPRGFARSQTDCTSRTSGRKWRSRFWMPCFKVAVDDGQPEQAPFMAR